MNIIFCAGVEVLISWAALAQARKAHRAGQVGKARVWLLAAGLAGVLAVGQIAGIITMILDGSL